MINPTVSIMGYSDSSDTTNKVQKPQGFDAASLRFTLIQGEGKRVSERIVFQDGTINPIVKENSFSVFDCMTPLPSKRERSGKYCHIRVLVIDTFANDTLMQGLAYLSKDKQEKIADASKHQLVVTLRTPHTGTPSAQLFTSNLEQGHGFTRVTQFLQVHPKESGREFLIWQKNVNVSSNAGPVVPVPPAPTTGGTDPTNTLPQPPNPNPPPKTPSEKKDPGFLDKLWELIKWLFCCSKTVKPE